MATNDVWTLANLLAFVTEAGDFYSPGFSDALKTRWLNAGISAFVDLVFQIDDTRFMKEGTITVAAGTDSYNLKDSGILAADDFYRARGFAVPDTGSASGFSRIKKFEWSERHDYDAGSRGDNRLALWDVQGDDLLIWPKPSWSGDCLLEYFQLPASLVNGSDEVNLRNHVAFVVTFACVHLAPRDESSNKDWQKLLSQEETRIRAAGPQNRSEPKSATNVYGGRRRGESVRQRRLATS